MSIVRKYGLRWEDMDDLQIEMACVRKGGRWKMGDGKEYGLGLFEHFRKMQSLLWPDDDHHTWSDLILKTILENRMTVVQGSRDSSKTRTMSKYALSDYWCYPNETLILMSSTDIRGLELRVWGDLKDLFDRARERWPWLAGNVVDAKHGVFTDTLGDDGDVRDMRRGILCIPCIGSDGQWAGGLEKFVGIKQKRRRLLGDECFPTGTMVDTPNGPVAIETINPGDHVVSAIGIRRVLGIRRSFSNSLCKITTKDGRETTCTQNHKFFTQLGWIKACELNQSHYMLSPYETLQIVQERIQRRSKSTNLRFLQKDTQAMRRMRDIICSQISPPSIKVLREIMPIKMAIKTTGVSREVLLQRASGKIENCKNSMAQRSQGAFNGNCEKDAGSFARARITTHKENERSFKGVRTSTEVQGREWNRPNEAGIEIAEDDSWWDMELRRKDGSMEWKRIPSGLQGRCGIAEYKIGDRSGREFAHNDRSQVEGQKEGCETEGAWVDSVEILERNDNESSITSAGSSGHRVYNLQVEGHPSYSVNGFCVHNCQFMHINYINVLSNLDKGNFKGCFVGNPIGGNGKALDKIAEPESGWDSLGEVTKTTTWKNRYEGITINLVGTDSPNFDPKRPKDYSYLVDQADVDRVLKRSGKDSAEFWSQIMGVRKIGVDNYRVITRSMALKFRSFDKCIWSGKETIKVLGIDAGYGGDPCECTPIEFGEEVTGVTVVKFSPVITIPIMISSTDTAEDQIAIFVKNLLPQLNVVPAGVFFEAGMRASLAISMARIVGNEVNAVNAGGAATDRPVCNDMFIFDDRTQTRRLKKCSEHYSKFITEMWFQVRQAVESYQVREIPEDVVSEFAMREWHWTNGNRYELETKMECKQRMGSSPNRADSASIALEGARRLGFVIERMKDENNDAIQNQGWLDKELRKERDKRSKYQLTYNT